MGRVKTTDHRIDVEELMREIERYLAVVEAFRAAGCEVGGIGRRRRSKQCLHSSGSVRPSSWPQRPASSR